MPEYEESWVAHSDPVATCLSCGAIVYTKKYVFRRPIIESYYADYREQHTAWHERMEELLGNGKTDNARSTSTA